MSNPYAPPTRDDERPDDSGEHGGRGDRPRQQPPTQDEPGRQPPTQDRPRRQPPTQDGPGRQPPAAGYPPPHQSFPPPQGPGRPAVGRGPSGAPGTVPPGTRRPAGPPAPPDPGAAALAARRVGTFGVLMLASIVVSTFALPWQTAAIVFALAAVVVGVRALVLTWRARVRGSLPVMLTLGVLLSGLWTLMMAGTLLVYPVQLDRQECLAGALTVDGRSACDRQYQDDLDHWRDSLERRAHTLQG